MGELLIGCSGWSYSDPAEKGGWVGVFYPNKSIKKLPYYSQFFNTAEFDSIYYEKFYSKMGQKTFEGVVNSTPDDFQFSVKVPETITRFKKLSVKDGAMTAFEEFLDRISPLKKANKLGALLFQMSPNFTVDDFKSAESFLDKLPRGYDYALEFRHTSWHTEGALEMLKHYNIANVITDSGDPKLIFLAYPTPTANHEFIRLHGRGKRYWYNYLYSKEELEMWVRNVAVIKKHVRILRIFFNNHYGGKAVLNALQFKELLGILTEQERKALAKAQAYLSGKDGLQKWLD